RPPFGDLAQPDRRKVRPRFRLACDRLDHGADVIGRIGARRRRRFDAAGDRTEHVAEDLAVEARLAVEVVVEHRLVDAGGLGDPVYAGAREPARRELRGGSREEPRARLPCRATRSGPAGSWRRWGPA